MEQRLRKSNDRQTEDQQSAVRDYRQTAEKCRRRKSRNKKNICHLYRSEGGI